MKLQGILFIALASFLLTGCGYFGTPLPEAPLQANLTAKCPDLIPPEGDVMDMGSLLDYAIYEAGEYQACQARHNALVDAVSPVQKKFWTIR